ncbi:MAG: YraN family protein [Anaerolineae bacterium]
MSSKKTTGALGEQLACDALVARGYQIVARNWRCATGEVDIVARDGACWVFVEVKTRRGQGRGLPEDAFTPRKGERVSQLAEVYLAEQGLPEVDWRVDLVAVELDAADRLKRLDVVPCAVRN